MGILELIGNKAKGQISKRVFQEIKARQIFQKRNIWKLVRVYFSENLMFWFLETPVLRFPLLPYYRRTIKTCENYKQGKLVDF